MNLCQIDILVMLFVLLPNSDLSVNVFNMGCIDAQ